MKVVILGGAGFVGSNLAKSLLDRHNDLSVSVVDNLSTGSMEALRYLHGNPRFDFYLGSVSDIFFVELVTAEASYVINAINTEDTDVMVHTMVVGTQNILECLCPEQRYIHLSYPGGTPDSLHSACTLSAESIVRAYNQEHKYRSIIMRIGSSSTEQISEEISRIILPR
jgi:nucleoside-diphosphate-sugar epimerase